MTFLEEPGNKGSKELSDLGLTTAEISTLLTSADGHGLGNYLSDNCWNQVASGQTLKTPFRVLWYAECCGLTQTTTIDGKDDFREVSLRDILDMLNKSNEMKGKKAGQHFHRLQQPVSLWRVSCKKPSASSCWLTATTRPSSCCLSTGPHSSSLDCVPITSVCLKR